MTDEQHGLSAQTMQCVVTTGVGGYDRLSFTERPVPKPARGEVLIKVLAAGVNNTEINTRLGWYSDSVSDGTNQTSEAGEDRSDGGWSAPTPFPFIQGTDCCGKVVGSGGGSSETLMHKRVLVRPCMRTAGFDDPSNHWLGSDFDGAFAQYLVAPADEVFPVACNWSDAELATIPCAYGTAENLIHRAGVKAGERVLITGASGGVGSAAVQLARRRGADVVAVANRAKHAALAKLGAATLLDRDADIVEELGAENVDVVIDPVGGPGFPALIEVLKRQGRYASSGAIAGPMVQLDLRKMYLKDLTLIGGTAWDEPVFSNLVGYIERGEIRPLLFKTFPLSKIVDAQKAFQAKAHVGKMALLPWE